MFPEHAHLEMNRILDCPFKAEEALDVQSLSVATSQMCANGTVPLPTGLSPIEFVPDRVEIPLEKTQIDKFLFRELDTPVLDFLYPRLWMAARRSGAHIDPLHLQKIKGRQIVACEQAKLHLIWVPDRIYTKPIPRCLFNHDFWTHFLPVVDTMTQASTIPIKITNASKVFDRTVALGFVRSYAFLIQSPIDHKIAVDEGLIPKDVDWIEWSTFIQGFRRIPDSQVANRYHYGQIRMSRLHWLKRIFGAGESTRAVVVDDRSSRFFYEVPLWSPIQYIHAAFTTLLFLFATMSLVLSAMQVILTTPSPDDRSLGGNLVYGGVQAIKRSSFVFSIMVELAVAFSWACILIIPAVVLVWQMEFGFRRRHEPIPHVTHT